MYSFSRPACSVISTFAPSYVPSVIAPLSISFMLPVPDASVPAVEICSDTSAAGISFSAHEQLWLCTNTTFSREEVSGSLFTMSATMLVRWIIALARA